MGVTTNCLYVSWVASLAEHRLSCVLLGFARAVQNIDFV